MINLKKLHFIIFVIMLIPAKMLATAQFGENIFMNGKMYTMCSCPLENNEALVAALKKAYPIRKVSSTALWRGYVGYWSIKDGSLYLDSLKYRVDIDKMRTVIPNKEGIFGKYMDENGVKASWFSGELRVIEGKQIRYVHMGFGSSYEKETFITVKKGSIGETRQMENEQIYENEIKTVRGSKAINDAFVKEFPNIEGNVWAQFSYSEFDKNGKPQDVEVKVTSKGNTEHEEAIKEFIRSYILEKHVLGLYKINGKLVSEKCSMRFGKR